MVTDQPPTQLERIEAPVRPVPAAAITPENPPLPDRRGDRAVQTLDVAPNVSVMEGDRKVITPEMMASAYTDKLLTQVYEAFRDGKFDRGLDMVDSYDQIMQKRNAPYQNLDAATAQKIEAAIGAFASGKTNTIELDKPFLENAAKEYEQLLGKLDAAGEGKNPAMLDYLIRYQMVRELLGDRHASDQLGERKLAVADALMAQRKLEQRATVGGMEAYHDKHVNEVATASGITSPKTIEALKEQLKFYQTNGITIDWMHRERDSTSSYSQMKADDIQRTIKFLESGKPPVLFLPERKMAS